MIDVPTAIWNSIRKHPDRTAFVIKGNTYSYEFLGKEVSRIYSVLKNKGIQGELVGLYATDSIETYATILALWLTGNAYLPLHPKNSVNKNLELLHAARCNWMAVPSMMATGFENKIKMLFFEEQATPVHNVEISSFDPTSWAYLLFTSGSTGKPKGVPISRNNLNAFVHNFLLTNIPFYESDCILQPFDLTFDVSVFAFVLPLLSGASVYTIPETEIKYLYALKLLSHEKISVTVHVPSLIRLMEPFFDRLRLPHVRISIFTGEALPSDLLQKWKQCAPSAEVYNFYGPTEATIFCTYYTCGNKHYNGMVSIGKPLGNNIFLIVDEHAHPVPKNTKGELWVAGPQLFENYYPPHSSRPFATYENTLYYKTGDLVFEDEDGDLIYCGRIDHQVQIGGYRIEPAEVEYAAKKIFPESEFIAIPRKNNNGQLELLLLASPGHWQPHELSQQLKSVLPFYMLPAEIKIISRFPYTLSGKIDRKSLIQQYGFSHEQ